MKKIKIAFFSTSRAEFGNMVNLINKLNKNLNFKIFTFLGGAHLVKAYGKTISEAKENDILIKSSFSFFKSSLSDESSLINQMSVAQNKISKIFKKYDFDYVVLFGDRFELLPIISNVIIFRKKLIHFGGGEITTGSIDNTIRNIISKTACLHFVSSNEYKKNLINMGENKDNIFNVGSLSITKKIKKINYEKKIRIKLKKFDLKKRFILVSYHSETMDNLKNNIKKLKNIFRCLINQNFNVVVTAPNKEIYSNHLSKVILSESKKRDKIFYCASLGSDLFKFLLKKSLMIIGNSSAGIILAPYFKIPSINVGNRQLGRIIHTSVISSNGTLASVKSSIKKVLSKNFQRKLKTTKYKLYVKDNLNLIAKKIIKYDRKKK